MIQSLVNGNLFTTILIVGMYILIHNNKSFDKWITDLFLVFTITVLGVVITDSLDFFFKSEPILYEFRYFTTGIGYVIKALVPIWVILITLRKKKITRLLWVPIAILLVLVIVNFFTGCLFTIDGTGSFVRGPLGYLPHIITLLYLVILGGYIIKEFHSYGKGEVVLVMFIILINTMATILESAAGFKFMVSDAMTISSVFYYIYLYIQIYKYDVLTGLLNRHSFYLDTTKLLSNPMAVITVDINFLKEINDTGGHREGDVAITTLANCLTEAATRDFIPYRTGGDEFIVIGVRVDSDEAESYIARVREQLAATEYSAAIGYAMYSPEDVFEDICNESDEEMYLDKMEIKRNMQRA